MNRAEYSDQDFQEKTVNIGSVAAVIVGALVGLLLPWGIAPVNALVVAAVICFASEIMARSKKTA
jgi:cytosine permease